MIVLYIAVIVGVILLAILAPPAVDKGDQCASDGCVECGEGFDKHAEEAIRMVRDPK